MLGHGHVTVERLIFILGLAFAHYNNAFFCYLFRPSRASLFLKSLYGLASLIVRVAEVFVINDQHRLHNRNNVGPWFRSEECISGNSSLKEKSQNGILAFF
jgi:hypothetical protein